MKIKSVSMLKHQRDDVWATVRDRLGEIVPLIDDIESVTMESREQGRDGAVRLVNIWKAKPKLPAIVASTQLIDSSIGERGGDVELPPKTGVANA